MYFLAIETRFSGEVRSREPAHAHCPDDGTTQDKLTPRRFKHSTTDRKEVQTLSWTKKDVDSNYIWGARIYTDDHCLIMMN